MDYSQRPGSAASPLPKWIRLQLPWSREGEACAHPEIGAHRERQEGRRAQVRALFRQ